LADGVTLVVGDNGQLVSDEEAGSNSIVGGGASIISSGTISCGDISIFHPPFFSFFFSFFLSFPLSDLCLDSAQLLSDEDK
jgi:hypothetical protein